MSARNLALVALAVLSISSSVSADPDAQTLAAAYANPTLGTAVRVSDLTVTLANTTFTMSGSVAPVMVNDTVRGFFADGEGAYRLKTSDPAEAKLVPFQSKKLDRKATKQSDGSVVVEDRFDSILLLVSGASLPDLARFEVAGGAADLAGAFNRHREKFANAEWASNAHLLAMRDVTSATTPVAIAEMSGREATGWILDTVESKRESLIAFVATGSAHSAIRKLMIPVRISEQPVGVSRSEFVQPLILLVDVDYRLVDEAKAAKLTVTETIVPRRLATSAFRLNLRSGYWDDDLRFHPLKVSSVKDENGANLKFDFRENSIIVDAGRTLPVGEPFAVRFEIEGDFLIHPNGDSFWSLNAEPWFPQPDLNGQFYTVHSVVSVRKPWVAFSQGTTVARKAEGEFNTVESVVDKPIQFAIAHAGKYTTYEEQFDDLKIRVSTYATSNERAAKQLAKFASQIIKFYQPWLGPFPFKEFDIIEVNDLGMGQAPAATLFITKEAFNPLINEENRLYSEGVNQRFAHEIAHQYFGHVVKMGSEEEQWITEGFAEYVSALVEKQITGKGGYDKLVSDWRLEAKRAGEFAPIVLANRIYFPSDWIETRRHRNGLLYSKGAWLLSTLHKELGDEKFFLVLRNVTGQYGGRFITTKNIVDVMKRVTGKDYSSTFDKVVWGTEMPAK